jgi:soluble lytic murein transglycosylase-like protein
VNVERRESPQRFADTIRLHRTPAGDDRRSRRSFATHVAVRGILALAALAVLGAPWADASATVPDGPPPSPLVQQAIALEHGEGVPKDQKQAAALYCVAARDGDAEALFGLGWMYANGRGVARDDATAAALFAHAAAAGHEHARRMLERVGSEPGLLPPCMDAPATQDALAADALSPDASAVEPYADPFAALSPRKQKIIEIARNLAPRFEIEPALALAVIATESNFEPDARSPKDARGLMQLIPETAARFNVRNAYDVHDNMRGGLAYLRWLLSYYRGEVALVAAAYNAGEGTVDRYGGVPPFPETRDYVRRVLRLFHRSWHPYDPALVTPSKVADTVRRPETTGSGLSKPTTDRSARQPD